MEIGMKTIRAERMSRSLVFMLVVSLALALGGCPREAADELLPRSAAVCEDDADCNPAPLDGRLCGELFACVDSYCEEEPNLLIPCQEE